MSGSAKGVTAAKEKGRKFIKNRGYGKATQIKAVEEPTDAAIDIKADYEASKGVLGAGEFSCVRQDLTKLVNR